MAGLAVVVGVVCRAVPPVLPTPSSPLALIGPLTMSEPSARSTMAPPPLPPAPADGIAPATSGSS